jgi:dolichol-phosphate mannosyltransferase
VKQLDLTITLLTKNEAENIRMLLPQIHQVAKRMGILYEIMLVDAWSTDGTVEIAESHGARVITQSKPFYSSAITDAFENAKGEYILVMDADGTHSPQYIPRMWIEREGVDVVVASRYVPYGGSQQEWGRRLCSRLLNLCFGLALNVPVKDMSGAFRLYKKDVVKRLKIETKGIDVQEEIIIKLYRAGYKIKEVPFVYKMRATGRTKTKLIKYALQLIKTLIRLKLR